MSDEATTKWIESKAKLPETLHEEVKKRCQMLMSDMVDHNANDPAAKRAEAERANRRRLQDLALADSANTTVITIDDVGSDRSFRKRMIKVNDRRSYVRGKPVISANDVQWADPTTLSAKGWNFLVSRSILVAGRCKKM